MSAKAFNSFDRSTIVNAMLYKRFSAEQESIDALNSAIALRAYNMVFPPATRQRMDALPDGWLPKVKQFNVEIGGLVTNFVLPGKLPVPYERRHAVLFVFASTDSFAEDYRQLEERAEKLKEERGRAKCEIEAVLASVASLGSLLEIWPEAKQFCAFLEVGPGNLPAPRIAELNLVLGLTPGTETPKRKKIPHAIRRRSAWAT